MNPANPPKGYIPGFHDPGTFRQRKKKPISMKLFTLLRDFAISYRAFDDFGQEAYLPLVSDWDLGAAFTSASDPGKTIPSHSFLLLIALN